VPGLEIAISGAPFGAAAFVGLTTDEAFDVIEKLVAFGVIEKMQ
jgi:hypothetical protein